MMTTEATRGTVYVVKYRGDLIGPFGTRWEADGWISGHVSATVDPRELATWEIAPVRDPMIVQQKGTTK